MPFSYLKPVRSTTHRHPILARVTPWWQNLGLVRHMWGTAAEVRAEQRGLGPALDTYQAAWVVLQHHGRTGSSPAVFGAVRGIDVGGAEVIPSAKEGFQERPRLLHLGEAGEVIARIIAPFARSFWKRHDSGAPGARHCGGLPWLGWCGPIQLLRTAVQGSPGDEHVAGIAAAFMMEMAREINMVVEEYLCSSQGCRHRWSDPAA